MGKLFGTDGVRGLANVELTPELAYDLGRASAYVLTKTTNKKPTFIIGTDTRQSAHMLEASLTAGFCSVGANVISAGIIPTPGIAYLVQKYGLDAGVVISASHNPFEDNGIKFLNGDGFKLSDKIEEDIESLILENKLNSFPRLSGQELGTRSLGETALDDYIEHLKSTMGENAFSGYKVALDCANGAAYKAAPILFYELGAEVCVLHNDPNGININADCGSTHPESLLVFMRENKCDVGFAFDGDTDRCFAVDENGILLDGDEILAIWGLHLQKQNKLKNNTIVGTVMTNLGLSVLAKENNLNLELTNVGDRYVLERMLEGDFVLGGEQSGHIIYREYATTGDGLLTAMFMLKIVKESGKKLSELRNVIRKMPQVLFGARVINEKKNDYHKHENITNEIERLNKKYNGLGRINIRPSGTEPLVRVMIEGNDLEEIKNDALFLVNVIETTLS